MAPLHRTGQKKQRHLAMPTRSVLPRALACGLALLGVIGGPALAEELLGDVTKVDLEAKKIAVEGDDGTETIVAVTDNTQIHHAQGRQHDGSGISGQACRPRPFERAKRVSRSESPTKRVWRRKSRSRQRRRRVACGKLALTRPKISTPGCCGERWDWLFSVGDPPRGPSRRSHPP
jgi:hypothetical protein